MKGLNSYVVTSKLGDGIFTGRNEMEGVTVMENKQDAIFETIEKLKAYQSKKMAQNMQKMMYDNQECDEKKSGGCLQGTSGQVKGESSEIVQKAITVPEQKQADRNIQSNATESVVFAKRTQNIIGLQEEQVPVKHANTLNRVEKVKSEEKERKVEKKPTTLDGIERKQQDEKLNRANRRANLNDIQKIQEQEKIQKAQNIMEGNRNRALVEYSMEDYRIVREYLREHGSANALTIEKATGISRRVIDHMISENMLRSPGKRE